MNRTNLFRTLILSIALASSACGSVIEHESCIAVLDLNGCCKASNALEKMRGDFDRVELRLQKEGYDFRRENKPPENNAPYFKIKIDFSMYETGRISRGRKQIGCSTKFRVTEITDEGKRESVVIPEIEKRDYVYTYDLYMNFGHCKPDFASRLHSQTKNIPTCQVKKKS